LLLSQRKAPRSPIPLSLDREGVSKGLNSWLPGPKRRMAQTPVQIAIERIAGRLHRARRVVPGPPPVKVNLGSGMFVARGWINLDASLKALLKGWPTFALRAVYPLLVKNGLKCEEFVTLLRNERFVHHDLRNGLPFPDASVDFLYSSHALHHLYRAEAAKLLAEGIRTLKPGGTLRIVVPDLEFIMSLYQQGKRERALSYFFYDSPRSELFSRRYQYDFLLLRDLLESTGFRDVRRCAYQKGRTPDLGCLDRMPEESLFVEARRPPCS
jgi:SAM-dependent methyltransferase